MTGPSAPFGCRLLPWILVSLCASLVACGPARRANFVFVVIDTLRADHLGAYGYGRRTSPSIDALAADSVRFERAYAPAPWTKPSVASLITGTYPSTHGVIYMIRRLPNRARTLAEVLGGAGYRTRAVVSHDLLGARWNFDQGYDALLEDQAKGVDHVSTDNVTRQAIEALDELAADQRPFYLFVHYFDPHYTYKQHDDVDFAADRVGRLSGGESMYRLRGLRPRATPEEVDFIRDLYDEEIRSTDAGVGRLLAALDRLGLRDDTLIVLVADHGEEFFEHGWLGHSVSLYEGIIRVPLVIRPPRWSGGSRTVSTPVSTVSLMPTALELLGVDAEGLEFEETSLAPLLRGAAGDERALVHSEVDIVKAVGLGKKPPPPTVRMRAVIGSRYKLIFDELTGRYELYDLERDPGERENAIEQKREIFELLRPHLERAATPEGSLPPLESELSEAEVEKLRALGYLDDAQ